MGGGRGERGGVGGGRVIARRALIYTLLFLNIIRSR